MPNLTGSSTAEIDAPLDKVWALVEDVEVAPEWQGGVNAIRGVERDDAGRAVVCETESDAKVRTLKSTVRFTYDGPTKLSWKQLQGDPKAVDGSWTLEDLGGGRTRATYAIDIDLGRPLGLVIRGPVETFVRNMLVAPRAGELKQRIESGA
jgi:carbon monoxide dehydrogenase subunit G